MPNVPGVTFSGRVRWTSTPSDGDVVYFFMPTFSANLLPVVVVSNTAATEDMFNVSLKTMMPLPAAPAAGGAFQILDTQLNHMAEGVVTEGNGT